MTDKQTLVLYDKEIDATNVAIKLMDNWTEYQIKFKHFNPNLYKALCKIKLTSIKNEYLRNWVRMLRNE